MNKTQIEILEYWKSRALAAEDVIYAYEPDEEDVYYIKARKEWSELLYKESQFETEEIAEEILILDDILNIINKNL